MATYTGDGGIIKTGSTPVTIGEILGWTVEQSTDTIEDTVVGDTAKTFVAGLTGWTGTCEAILSDSDAGQALMDNGSTQTALDFYFDASTSGYKGNALVTGISTTSAMGDMIKVSLTFQGTGALTSDPWS
jgi:hypothetical protein